jgi:ribonuclease HI
MGRWRKPDDPAQSTIIDPTRHYRLQFDGGARDHVGAGMVLYDDDGTEIWCGWHFHPESVTNNVAEYMDLICGLRCARSLGITKLIVEGDSLLVVQQMMGKCQTRERELDMFREEAHVLIKYLSYFQIRYITRAENKRADWLANHAMNLKESHGFTRINDNPIITGRKMDQAI